MRFQEAACYWVEHRGPYHGAVIDPLRTGQKIIKLRAKNCVIGTRQHPERKTQVRARERSRHFPPMIPRNAIVRAQAASPARLAECLLAHAREHTLLSAHPTPRARPRPSCPAERERAIPLTRPARAALRLRRRLNGGGRGMRGAGFARAVGR